MVHFIIIMEIQRVFVENIKYYRKKKGLTQAQLAERCDMSSGMIGRIESFSASPSLETIERISRALEVSPDRLFLDRSDPSSYQNPAMEELASDIRQIISQYTNPNKSP